MKNTTRNTGSTHHVRPGVWIFLGGAVCALAAGLWFTRTPSTPPSPQEPAIASGEADAQATPSGNMLSPMPTGPAATKPVTVAVEVGKIPNDSTTPLTNKVDEILQIDSGARQEIAVKAANDVRQHLAKPTTLAASPAPTAPAPGSPALPRQPAKPATAAPVNPESTAAATVAAVQAAVPTGADSARGYRESDRVRRAFVSEMRSMRQAAILEATRNATNNQ